METKYLFSFIFIVLFSVNLYSQIRVNEAAPTNKPTEITKSTPNKPVATINNVPYTPNPTATINNPKDGSVFISSFNVNGIAKNIPTNKHLWLVVCPQESNASWPQYKEIIPNQNTGTWNGKVKIGGDKGKLLNILLVSANSEANRFFNDYISNQVKDNFPERPMPEGIKTLAHITVIKAQEDDTISYNINRNYGFTKSGIFYIHKSLIIQSNGDRPCLVAGITNWRKDIKMQLEGDYYVYKAKIDKPYVTKLEYCFYIGNGNFLPQLLLEKSSNLIINGDYKDNETKNGSNFYTSPQELFPGDKN